MSLTITRLWALLASVAHFIAVAALDKGHVAGLSAFLSHVAFLATVAAAARASFGAVLGKVTHLVALATLDAFGRAGFGACNYQFIFTQTRDDIVSEECNTYSRRPCGQAVDSFCRHSCHGEGWDLERKVGQTFGLESRSSNMTYSRACGVLLHRS